ncbi:MAG TPA: ABC transporter permease subunit [Solirubrobacteraceae bacterium]|nr:ABC transporter permease subunit [Solirubrobacteraceae bacterium]
MNATVAAQMTGADFLKLRKKRGTVIWSLVLAILPLLAFFIVRAVQHSSNPGEHPPAGGLDGFHDALRIVALFFGPLAAILIGVEGGSGDAVAGVLRDLIATGRSRLALFATRLPAALALCFLVVGVSYGVLLIGTYALASSAPTPDAALVFNGLGFSLLSTGVVCAVAVGFSSLLAARPAALTALIGWQLVASPILVNITSLGSSRKLILSQAIVQFSPVHIGDRNSAVSMSDGTALAVMLVWTAVFVALGAWRMRTMDA